MRSSPAPACQGLGPPRSRAVTLLPVYRDLETDGTTRGAEAAGGEQRLLTRVSTETKGEPRWRALLSSIRAVQMELKRALPERPIGLAGNPAAPESALHIAELRLGRRLPPSYREFLSFSDGWPVFFEGAHLLGTADIGRHGADAVAAGRMLPERRLLPFGADSTGASLFAFDTRVRLVDGELPVVAWIGGLGIDCRCFTSFLATVLQLCRADLAQVKGSAALRENERHVAAAGPLARRSPSPAGTIAP